MSTLCTKRIQIEFETGGNVRLEEGNSSDLWFRNCVELVSSKFSEKDYRSTGICGIRVTRVIRVHNRHLRNRFESGIKRYNAAKTRNHGSCSHAYEYLFYGEVPLLCEKTQNQDELLRITEEGFRSPESYEALGYNSAVTLFASVAGADQERLCFGAMSQHEQSTDGGCQSHCVDSVLNHGQLIIAKTHIGQCVEGEADDHGTISLANSHLYNSVYINKGPETNHRQARFFFLLF
jgi:hypothetical protein